MNAARLLGLVVTILAGTAACGGHTKDANAPSTPGADTVALATEMPAETCKALGTVKGRGHDHEEKVALDQALKGARESASKMGGDTIFQTDASTNPEAGSGGTIFAVTRVFRVFSCVKR